mmetsp:Transcript_79205/g.154913  ORF Transcript_79205/g.154913 Transcript_79205/m.154913 type:complete len:209 (-) Transcript_79205:218-844(-)
MSLRFASTVSLVRVQRIPLALSATLSRAMSTQSAKMYTIVEDPSQPGADGSLGVKPIAARNIDRGEVVFSVVGPIFPQASMHSVQVGIDTHMEFSGDGRYLSHSFNPNCAALFTGDLHLQGASATEASGSPILWVAVRPIEEAEELSFDYTTTEWEGSSPFLDSESGREMRGFKHLSPDEKEAALATGSLAPHIMRLWIRDLLDARST